MITEELGDLAPLATELEQALAPTIQLGGLLGRGGMGAVFLGRDPALKRSVVIKVLSPDLAHDETARKRFAREAESAAAVAHPNVVAVHLVGELPKSKTSYFVMQHVDGVTLGDACPGGVKVPSARVRRIVGEVASALAAAHARGLVHRDIKPANVMLEKGSERAIVLDFGISAALAKRGDRGGADARLTQQGTSLGTPQYMSPEQAAGDDVTGQSDVYSLGVVAFELLAGRAPFEATSPMALAAAHIKDTPPDLLTLRPDLDPAFSELVGRMLAKKADERPDASEVARALLPSAHAVVEWPPPGLERLKGDMARVERWLVGTMVLLLGLFLVLALQPSLEPVTFVGLVAIAGFGSIAAVVAPALAVGIAGGRMAWARESGYPYWTALDVALDAYPDTGEMINATGRYAALQGRGERGAGSGGWKLLRRRRWAALAIGAGVVASAGLIFLWAAGRLGLPDAAMAPITFAEMVLLMAPALAGMLAWWLLQVGERRLRKLVRPREELRLGWRRKVKPVPPELVAGWLAGAGVAPLPKLSRFRAGLLRNAYEAPIGVASLLLEGAVLAVVMGSMFLPRAAREDNRERRIWRQEAVAAALEGGFRTLDAAVGWAARAPEGAAADTAAARAFVAASRAASDGGEDAGIVKAAFARLPGRLPDSLRTSLRRMVAADSPRVFERVASSGPLPAVWYGGTQGLRGDSLATMLRTLNPMLRAAVRRTAAAALALESGDRGGAVRAARQVVAVGRQLWRDPVQQAAAVGLGMLDMAAETMRAISLATGDGALGREADSLGMVVEARRRQMALFMRYRFVNYLAAPDDTVGLMLVGARGLAPSDRWNVMSAIAHGSCWNPVEVRRGVSAKRRAMLAEAAHRAEDIGRSNDWASVLSAELDEWDGVTLLSDLPWVMGWLRSALRATMCSG